MEPFRPIVDLQAVSVVSNQVKLTREQRQTLMSALYLECRINAETTTVINAVDLMVNSIKAYIMGNTDTVMVPEILPIKNTGGIRE